jgi:hypothetical protein
MQGAATVIYSIVDVFFEFCMDRMMYSLSEINKLGHNTKTDRSFSSMITYKRRRVPAAPHMSEAGFF